MSEIEKGEIERETETERDRERERERERESSLITPMKIIPRDRK